MDELASTEFRKTFASLDKPTIVTANGHPIGTWTPLSISWKEAPDGVIDVDLRVGRVAPPAGYGHSRQLQRDDLLRKINKGL
jgi:hypothetical protein